MDALNENPFVPTPLHSKQAPLLSKDEKDESKRSTAYNSPIHGATFSTAQLCKLGQRRSERIWCSNQSQPSERPPYWLTHLLVHCHTTAYFSEPSHKTPMIVNQNTEICCISHCSVTMGTDDKEGCMHLPHPGSFCFDSTCSQWCEQGHGEAWRPGGMCPPPGGCWPGTACWSPRCPSCGCPSANLTHTHLFILQLYCPIEISPMENLSHFSWGNPAATVVLPKLQCLLVIFVFLWSTALTWSPGSLTMVALIADIYISAPPFPKCCWLIPEF